MHQCVSRTSDLMQASYRCVVAMNAEAELVYRKV